MSDKPAVTVSSEAYLNLPHGMNFDRSPYINELPPVQQKAPGEAAPIEKMLNSCTKSFDEMSLTLTNIYDQHPYISTLALLTVPCLLNPKATTLIGEGATCLSGRLRYAGAEALDIAANKPYQLRVYEWNTAANMTSVARDSRTGRLLASARDAVARVTGESAPHGEVDTNSIATAFAVTKDGRFVTNYHVIKNFPTCKLVDKFGWGHEASVLMRDEKNDLAVLQLNNKMSYSAFKPLSLDDGLAPGLSTDNELVAFGHSNACRNLHMSRSAKVEVNWPGTSNSQQQGRAVVPLTIRPGNSGSPVLDCATGKVVGIAQAVPSEKEFNWKLSVVVPSNKARTLLEQSKL